MPSLDAELYAEAKNPTDGGGLPQLAPDLTFPADRIATQSTYKRIDGIDATGGLTAALSLTGKYIVNYLSFTANAVENNTIKLTIDGVVIWDSTFIPGANSIVLFGNRARTNAGSDESLQCNTSLLLEIQTTSDNSISLEYIARPIL